MRIALIGATGIVGEAMRQVLEERGFKDAELIPVASEKSVGKKLSFGNREYSVVSIEEALTKDADVALFSAGSEISKQYAPQFAALETRVVDNSAAWRMVPQVPLIVPEVNPDDLKSTQYIIANPNCSTIQMIVPLSAIHRAFGVKRVDISTYQSVSGSGMKGVRQLQLEREGKQAEDPAYKYPIDLNCIPHCDDFLENGYTKEEMKLVNETRKMLHAPEMRISATAVRVPVWGGHSESVSIECERPITPAEVRELLANVPGVKLVDDPAESRYPMAILAHGKDEIFVGRIREDLAAPGYGIKLWIVADNIRKGAATNAVQIVELIRDRYLS